MTDKIYECVTLNDEINVIEYYCQILLVELETGRVIERIIIHSI